MLAKLYFEEMLIYDISVKEYTNSIVSQDNCQGTRSQLSSPYLDFGITCCGWQFKLIKGSLKP